MLSKRSQVGVTLIELMVGITIGLLVIAAAIGALMASRGISGTISEATTLQQQAAYAFRVIGLQVRQAGGIELTLSPNIMPTASGINEAMNPVAFDAPDPTGVRPPFVRASSTLTGTITPTFTVGYQNYNETVTTPGSTTTITSSLLRDCLGQNPALSSGGSVASTPVLTSTFSRDTSTNELKCVGAGGSGQQAIIGNVTDLQIRYVRQVPSQTTMQYRTPAQAIADAQWQNIYAIEVCLELSGTETISTPGATYTNCNGNSTTYGNRLKMVFRNLYQLRSQGQV